jgi:hypothetical protein
MHSSLCLLSLSQSNHRACLRCVDYQELQCDVTPPTWYKFIEKFKISDGFSARNGDVIATCNTLWNPHLKISSFNINNLRNKNYTHNLECSRSRVEKQSRTYETHRCRSGQLFVRRQASIFLHDASLNTLNNTARLVLKLSYRLPLWLMGAQKP